MQRRALLGGGLLRKDAKRFSVCIRNPLTRSLRDGILRSDADQKHVSLITARLRSVYFLSFGYVV